jgi:TPR repeat protein
MQARFRVGLAYDQGKAVEKDIKAALEWYRQSAEQG